MTSDLAKRILELSREYRSLDDKLRAEDFVKRLLKGHELKGDLPEGVADLLVEYRLAVSGLSKLRIDVDRSLIDLLGKSSCKKGSINYTDSDYLVLKDISCVGSDGKVFEHYDELRVAKDIARNTDGSQMNFTLYNAAAYFEKQGSFLHSMALGCNILKLLYENKDDAEVNKVLMQCKNKGNGYGWHAQNTLVDWGSKKIIHYPSDKDFPAYGGSNNINHDKDRKELGFNTKGFKGMYLEKALKVDNFKAFVQDLTGLQQPEILITIGKHFKRLVYISVSGSSDVRAAWLGCNLNYDYLNFVINANYYLLNNYAARGVRSQ